MVPLKWWNGVAVETSARLQYFVPFVVVESGTVPARSCVLGGCRVVGCMLVVIGEIPTTHYNILVVVLEYT